MKIRVFGSKSCEKCNLIIDELKKEKISYSFIDANADETQSLCDMYNVDELPHIQVISGNGNLIKEHIGYIPIGKLVDNKNHESNNDA